MRHHLAVVLGLSLLFALGPAAAAKERGVVSVVETDNTENLVFFGRPFPLKIQVNYFEVPRDRVVIIRISDGDEPHNGSLNGDKVQNACKDMSKSACDGFWMVEFKPQFKYERYGKRTIRIQLITQTMDGKAIHFMNDRDFTVDLRRPPEIKIDHVDAPRPPDTVRVNEPIPVRVKFSTSWLPADSRIKATIEAVEGGSGEWTWESGKLTGGVLVTSEPIQVKLDKAGRWKFRVKAETAFAKAAPVDFQMETVKQAKRVIEPVTIDYPKPPQTVRAGEAVRFDVTMGYKNLPSGTVAAIVFGDPATGQDLSEGWTTSRPISGKGTYKFENLVLHPAKKGDWKVKVMIRLPQLNPPYEYENFWTDTVTLKVVAKPDAPLPGDAEALQATITKIERPQGSLQLNEMAPIIITIRYDKMGESGGALRAGVSNLDTGASLGGTTSIWLKKNGTYTFPNISIKARPVGDLPLEAHIMAPDGRILAKKRFTLKVVS